MAITTLDGLIASTKRSAIYQKTATRTSVANVGFSVFDLAGNPGGGTLSAGNTANGVVPTDATPGYPDIPTAAANLHINRIAYRSSVACWLDLYDCLFSAGAYSYNADVTLSSQPSYVSRCPGSDYTGLELWIEAVTAFTSNQTVQINYLDQDGGNGDTGAIATGVAPILGRMLMLNLEAGDSGVSQIVRVRSSVSSAGTFNVHVMRHLWSGRVNGANQGGIDTLLRSGLPRIYDTSALRLIVTPDSTSTGLPSLKLTTVDG